MRKSILVAMFVALILPATGGAHPTKFSWTELEAIQRLEIGKFAAAHGIAHALCQGTGLGTGPSYQRRFKHFECKLLDKEFASPRQIVLHVRGETTFSVVWLTMKECG